MESPRNRGNDVLNSIGLRLNLELDLPGAKSRLGGAALTSNRAAREAGASGVEAVFDNASKELGQTAPQLKG